MTAAEAAARRSPRGPRFEADQVRRMKAAIDEGLGWREIERRFGASRETIQKLVAGLEEAST